MTDTERRDLDRLMAEKVMGWKKLGPCWVTAEGATTGYVWDPPYTVVLSSFSPTTDPRAANVVMARLADEAWQWRMTSHVQFASVELRKLFTNEWQYYAEAPTWLEALCLAAKKAWEAKP